MIVVTIKDKNYEFYNVPEKVKKAVVTLLKEFANTETKMIYAESEGEDADIN